MKYIHDTKDFLIFSSYEYDDHSQMANLCDLKPVHAGFLHFNENKSVNTYGEPVSLDLRSQPFELPEELYAARDVDRFNYVMISNSEELLRRMGLEPVRAHWTKCRDNEFNPGIVYPDVPNCVAPLRLSVLCA